MSMCMILMAYPELRGHHIRILPKALLCAWSHSAWTVIGGQVFVHGNYSGMLISRPIVILCLLAREITAEDAEDRRVVTSLFPLRVPLSHFAVKFPVWLQYAPCPG